MLEAFDKVVEELANRVSLRKQRLPSGLPNQQEEGARDGMGIESLA
jgi:hypothetical protein